MEYWKQRFFNRPLTIFSSESGMPLILELRDRNVFTYAHSASLARGFVASSAAGLLKTMGPDPIWGGEV